MQTIADFPYFELVFNKEGEIHQQQDLTEILDYLAESKLTDLFVISHGWNNDMEEARDLYRHFFAVVRAEIKKNIFPELHLRKFCVIGILWPSKKFAEEELIPGGTAGFNENPDQEQEEQIKQQLESLLQAAGKPDVNKEIDLAKYLIDQLQADNSAAPALVDIIRSCTRKQDLHPDDGSDDFFSISAGTMIDRLSRPDIPVSSTGEVGGAAQFDPTGISPALSIFNGFNFYRGLKSAIQKVLNVTTYFLMKERSGLVGRNGAYKALSQIREMVPAVKLHLIGHSFGGRLVTSLANGPELGKPIMPQSMTLIQAAFSHHGFAKNFKEGKDGFFRGVIAEKKVEGPILVTHSIKDFANSIAYPIVSKLSGVDAADFNGPASLYGGIGRNGCQHTPEADNNYPLGPVNTTYYFKSGGLYNLNSDSIILGHSDIYKPELAHALLAAVIVT